LRYSNVYGPRQNPKGEAGVISIFLDKLMKKEQPKICGDGKQTRDCVYSGDVARANLLALQKNPDLSQEFKIFNIATGTEASVNEIYSELRSILKSDTEAAHTDAVPGEVRHISLDAKHAEKYLGWKPEVGFKEGLKRTAEWFLKGHG